MDGEWKCNPTEPQANDVEGNRNNVYTTPPKPQLSTIMDNVKQAGTNLAAKDGTSSVFSYVTSGLGAAIASVTGVDPINSQQVSSYFMVSLVADYPVSFYHVFPRSEGYEPGTFEPVFQVAEQSLIHFLSQIPIDSPTKGK